MNHGGVTYLKDAAMRSLTAQSEQGSEREGPKHCRDDFGWTRMKVIVRWTPKPRELVIDYHRVKVQTELADLETGHLVSINSYRWTIVEHGKSAKGCLLHLERVAQAPTISLLHHETIARCKERGNGRDGVPAHPAGRKRCEQPGDARWHGNELKHDMAAAPNRAVRADLAMVEIRWAGESHGHPMRRTPRGAE